MTDWTAEPPNFCAPKTELTQYRLTTLTILSRIGELVFLRGGGRCPAPLQRPDDRRHLRQLARLDAFDPQAGGADRGKGVAVAMAAVAEEVPGPFEAVLPPGEAGLPGADVLEEQEP